MKYSRFIVLTITLCLTTIAQAVTGYSCDFENAEDRARWTINPTSSPTIYEKLTNKWYIGELGNNDPNGHYGLYISDDNGASNHYKNDGCWNFAYDTIALSHLSTDDNYTIVFDYCGMGNIASNFDGIYLLWIPMTDPDTGDSIPVLSAAIPGGSIPTIYNNYVIQLQPTALIDYVGGTTTWRQCVATIPNKKCDGKPHYLAFVWTNTSAQAQQPGGMIDNIAIMDTRPCNAPYSLSLDITGNVSTLTWKGDASTYEVLAYSYETDTWYGPTLVNQKTTSFASLPIGQTDFTVRAKCNDDLYSLKTTISKLIYYPDEMCVDYLNLENAKCYIGVTNTSSDTRTFNNFTPTPPVDEGPSQKTSRHTIHFDRSEVEPRTGGLAKTIPDGELASVRLGNWDNKCGTERIEFSFNVDTINYPVLLLKYMPLLEAPGHSDKENPRFKLDILIGNKSIGECGQADFNCNDVYKSGALLPGAEQQGWHITSKDVAQTSADIVWKEWTTVGVNLKDPEYQGKKLTIRLTTFDCTLGAHCGYAYFTLGCSDGQLKGMKCDAVNPIFDAPDGFVYRWMYAYNEQYRKADGSVDEKYVLGRSQKYEAGYHDDSLYVVDCMFVQDTTCYFSLYASTLATNPISVAKSYRSGMDCDAVTYTMHLDGSNSYVQEIDHVTADTIVSTRHKIQYYEWNFGDGQKSYQPVVDHVFQALPDKDTTYQVVLTTRYLTCEETDTLNLKLPALKYFTDTTIAYLCDADKASGKGYTWQGKRYTDYVVLDSVTVPSHLSCDTIHFFSLREPNRDTVRALIFDYETYNFHGTEYNKNGEYHYISESCDTAAVLFLSIYETLEAKLLTTNYIACQGDASFAFDVQILKGHSRLYSNVFEDSTLLPSVHRAEIPYVGLTPNIVVPLPADLYPNIYKGVLTMHDTLPEQDVKMPYTLEMRYPATVLTQRWNDVIAVKNAEYNDVYNPGEGYDFTTYQWYKNGEPISGATMSYLYVKDGLDFSATYSAEITRADGQKLMTCNFTPVQVKQIAKLPSLLPVGTKIQVQGKGMARWFTPLGVSVSEQQYNNSEVVAPASAGTYLLQLIPTDETSQPSAHRIVVH